MAKRVVAAADGSDGPDAQLSPPSTSAAGTATLINDTLDDSKVESDFTARTNNPDKGFTAELSGGGPGGIGKGGKGGNGGNGGNNMGGGLFVASGSAVTLANTYIAGDSALPSKGGAGGSGSSNGAGAVTVNPSAFDVSGAVTSSDHDLIGNTSGSSGFSAANGDILNPSSVVPEGLGYHGGPTAGAFAFRQDLLTMALPSSLAAWVNALNSGLSRQTVAYDFLYSGEFRAKAVYALYGPQNGYTYWFIPNMLNRAAAPSEVSAWVNSGEDLFTMEVNFASSAEFYNDSQNS